MDEFAVLFVDDEVEILETVGEYLSREGYRTTLSDNGLKALGLVKEQPFDVVFTDLKMPEFNGLELLSAIKKHRPETEVIIVTGYGTIESAIMAMKFGGYDYIQKPIKLGQLKMLCDKIRAEKQIQQEKNLLKKNLTQRARLDGLVGLSPRMQEVYATIERIDDDCPGVLIQGEKGTGKELVAKTVHRRSSKAKRPFVVVNCGAIAKWVGKQLSRQISELLDTVKGGTIFLDEVAQIPPAFWDGLLRTRGSGKRPDLEPGMDVRILAATQQDQDQVAEKNPFIKEFTSISLPPLRERREDLCLLVHHFLASYNGATGPGKVVAVSPEVLDIFLRHHWPGNVEELRGIIERAIRSGAGTVIEVSDLPGNIRKLWTDRGRGYE